MENRRVDLKKILADPAKRRKLMVSAIVATQAREGIATTREQAERAYDKILKENHGKASEAAQRRRPYHLRRLAG